MKYVLNIGEARSENFAELTDTSAPVTRDHIKAAAFLAKVQVMYLIKVTNEPENTFVLMVHIEKGDDARIETMANFLGQDCIAAVPCNGGPGKLIGQFADQWGEFNPDYFIAV